MSIQSQISQDPLLLMTAITAVMNEAVVSQMATAGVRVSHGYVFQHLIPGPLPVSELAKRLGITAQGTSKAVAELEGLGFVSREVDPQDHRIRIVALTEQGRAIVEAGRRSRAAANDALRSALGPEDAAALLALLQKAATATGALEAMASRRLKPPS